MSRSVLSGDSDEGGGLLGSKLGEVEGGGQGAERAGKGTHPGN